MTTKAKVEEGQEIEINMSELTDSVVNRLMSTSSYKIAPYTGSGGGVDLEKWI